MDFGINHFQWTREPERFTVSDDKVEIITKPHTDLWQRTYYHFRNDNAPVFQMETEEKYFSFLVRTEVESHHRFDQCGVVMYLPGKKNEYDDFSDTMLPEGIETVHPRYAIEWRNRWMLKRADFVVTYITHPWGGAAKFAEKAKREGKTVVNPFC